MCHIEWCNSWRHHHWRGKIQTSKLGVTRIRVRKGTRTQERRMFVVSKHILALQWNTNLHKSFIHSRSETVFQFAKKGLIAGIVSHLQNCVEGYLLIPLDTDVLGKGKGPRRTTKGSGNPTIEWIPNRYLINWECTEWMLQ